MNTRISWITYYSNHLSLLLVDANACLNSKNSFSVRKLNILMLWVSIFRQCFCFWGSLRRSPPIYSTLDHIKWKPLMFFVIKLMNCPELFLPLFSFLQFEMEMAIEYFNIQFQQCLWWIQNEVKKQSKFEGCDTSETVVTI